MLQTSARAADGLGISPFHSLLFHLSSSSPSTLPDKKRRRKAQDRELTFPSLLFPTLFLLHSSKHPDLHQTLFIFLYIFFSLEQIRYTSMIYFVLH